MSRRVKVDMTGVESYTRCPEGEWLAKIKKIEEVEIQGSGDDGLKAQFEVIKGDAKGNSVFETFSLTEKALWKLKSLLQAVGMKADGKLVLDLDKLEGKICIIDVVHDDYNGQKRAKISAYIKPGDEPDDEDEDEELEDEEEDEEEEIPAKKKEVKKTSNNKATSKPSKKHPEPEEDEDEEEDEEEEESVKPAKKKTTKKPAAKSKKPTSKKVKDPEPDDEDEDDWEEDED